jgi:hypothetical protein
LLILSVPIRTGVKKALEEPIPEDAYWVVAVQGSYREMRGLPNRHATVVSALAAAHPRQQDLQRASLGAIVKRRR